MADGQSNNIGKTLATRGETRIQLCGRLTARLEGRRVEAALPGRQGRTLFAYLAAHRRSPASRAQLAEAVWPGQLPNAADNALNALLAKLRTALGADAIVGKHEVHLALPPAAWIDIESMTEALHRAESAVALGSWARAWGPARVALHIASRPFLPGHDAPWIDDMRRNVNDVLLRAHECIASIGAGLGGGELVSAERSARASIKLAPYRESAHRLLMEALAAQGNVAEALLRYEDLRRLLRDELGTAPGPVMQALHKRLLQS